MKQTSTFVLVFGVLTMAASAHADDREAGEILRRALAAIGGERAVAGLKSPMMWMERGTFHGMGEGVPFVGQYSVKWPEWYRETIENAFTITVNGEEIWVSTANGVQQLDGPRLDERLKLVRLAWAERLFPLADQAYTLSKIDGIQVNGRPAVGIVARHPDQRDMKFFFDEETWLMLKIETLVVSPQHGPDPVLSKAYYSDHKSFSGVLLPSRRKLYYDKKLFVEAETIDYKMAATLDPKLFEGLTGTQRKSPS